MVEAYHEFADECAAQPRSSITASYYDTDWNHNVCVQFKGHGLDVHNTKASKSKYAHKTSSIEI